jgi:poly(3-hydroxybutyrate) depolymerase
VGRGSGALLAQRVAAENPEKAAAVVAVSSPADCKLDGLPAPKAAVAALIIDSAGSPAVGAAKAETAAASPTESIATRFWIGADKCESSSASRAGTDRTDYTCQGGVPVAHIRVVGLGDAWPRKIGREFSMRTLDGFFRHGER